jgi:hypothetical protein
MKNNFFLLSEIFKTHKYHQYRVQYTSTCSVQHCILMELQIKLILFFSHFQATFLYDKGTEQQYDLVG